METKIIKAVFGGGTSVVTNKRTRTDYGQVLEISGVDLPETFECIFSNSNTSAGVGKKMIGSSQRVLIPDEYLATGQTIYAWVLVHDGEYDGRHMYSIRIPVADMPDTSPEEPTPVEQSVISQAITALNSAVTTTSQKAQEASDSADRAEHAAEGTEGYAERAEAAQSASESARDITLEAKVSAQVSAATASEKASEAISSATTASQSALTAETASESASASADASYRNAETAYRYAQDSATSAEQASESAQTASSKASEASQKASEASTSALNASQAKTDAESAKTASQTAQTASESARDGAVTAKEDAESARDDAQDIVDGITGKVEQIDSNTERIESLEDDRYKPYPTDIASGSIASFPDGADDIPLKSCIVQVNPVQDLHGYDHPWPAGGGKNKLAFPYFESSKTNNGVTFTVNDDGTVRVNGTATARGVFYLQATGSNFHPDAGTYYTSKGSESQSATIIVEAYNGTTWKKNLASLGVAASVQFTVDYDGYDRVVAYISVASGNSPSNEIVKPMFRLSSVSDDTFAPYSNICPITGWTGAKVTRCGKNLWSFNSSYSSNNYTVLLNRVPFYLKAGTYTFSAIPNIEADTIVLFGYHEDGTRTEIGRLEASTTRSSTTKTVSKPIVSLFFVANRSGTISDIQLELGSTATDYEPYQGNTYPITFPTEAGTIYGGYVDVINGELVVDRAQIASYNGKTLPSTWISDRDVYASGTTPTIGAQVVYKLAEPIHYPITSHEVKSLLGQNNIWANAGDTSVTYRADTKLYIEKLTRPEEYDMIADSAINSGQFFMVGNSLYRALANIASGATITVGTNAQRVSLSDALNLVNA